MEKYEPRIKYAIDPDTGNIVDAQAGPLLKKQYTCLECKGRLVVRQGPVQTWHFQHFGDEAARECKLYYGGVYEDLLQKLRTSEVEEAERCREIRLVVEPRPGGRSLALYGILPTLDPKALPGETRLDEVLQTFQFKHEGLKSEPFPSLFHPSEAYARLELDPGASCYRLTIETTFNLSDLRGIWTTQHLQEKDVFAGDPTSAEKVKNVQAIREGDTVFILRSSEPDSPLPKSAQLYRMGHWYAIAFELRKETEPLFRSLTGVTWSNPPQFYADVVLPSHADPNSHHPIIGEPGSRVLVAVTPPLGIDPEFEIVSIPIKREGIKSLQKSGPDNPRWFETTFPDQGSTRLSIHWAGRHRAIHLHAATEACPLPTVTMKLRDQRILGFRILGDGIPKTLPPWEIKPIRVRARNVARTLKDFGITLSAPDGMRLDVVARFSPESGFGPTLRREDVTSKDLDRELYAWLKEGLIGLTLAVGPLGSMDVQFDPLHPWQKSLSDEELCQRLRELKIRPRKGNWAFVRELFNAPAGTPHDELPSGIKKRVRRLLAEVRKIED